SGRKGPAQAGDEGPRLVVDALGDLEGPKQDVVLSGEEVAGHGQEGADEAGFGAGLGEEARPELGVVLQVVAEADQADALLAPDQVASDHRVQRARGKLQGAD